jgi:ATP-binding cassette subfamily B protein/ATP-binding cassette subfamily C protein LapB
MTLLTTDLARLRACFDAVLACYNLRPDIDGLLSAIPRQNTALSLEDIPAILERFEYGLREDNVTAKELEGATLPALLEDADGVFYAYLPTRPEGERFFPNVPPESLDGQPLTFKARSVYPLKSTTLVDLSHITQGHSLDWFSAPIKRFYSQYGEVMLCTVFINLFILAYPLFSMNVYDRVVVSFAESTLLVLTIGVAIVLILDALFKMLRGHILDSVAAKVGTKYDSDLMERLIAVKPAYMQLSVGERANLFRELQSIRDFYALRLAPTVVDVPFFFLFVGTVAFISAPLALVPIVGALVILLMNWFVQVPINNATKSYFSTMQSKTTVLFQTLAGTRTIKQMNATGSKLFDWNVQSLQSADAARRHQTMMSLVNNMCVFVTYMVSIFTLFFGAYEIADGVLTTGGLVACTALSSRAIGPIVSLAGVVAQYKRCRDVLETIDKIFQLPSELDNIVSRPTHDGIKGNITFEDVSYQYQGAQFPALNKVSLSIKQGERVGLIGRTGAGKTTLAKMITSMLEPSLGSILIDQYAMSAYSPHELRRNIGYVPQDGYFFSGSIESNILMGYEATPEDLNRAVRLSGLDSVMKNTGRGLDMDVGENGDRLSGGQKQSIALARAFVRNPPVLVFDEPTNGIDTALETTIKGNLDSYLSGRTFIMITHRTSLLSLVDRLILIDKGRIVADGPRDEILKKLGGAA